MASASGSASQIPDSPVPGPNLTSSRFTFVPSLPGNICSTQCNSSGINKPRVVPSHRPPYNEAHHISGFNLFVSAYHGFAQLGREHVPEPQPFPQFPPSALELLQITHNSGIATLRCRLTLADTVHPERWHVSARIQLAPPGVGYDPSKMRNYMSIRNQDNEIVFNVPSPNIEDYQVHIRYRLIGEMTGYKNNWNKYNAPQ